MLTPLYYIGIGKCVDRLCEGVDTLGAEAGVPEGK